MNIYTLKGLNYCVEFLKTENNIVIKNGNFGEIKITDGKFFCSQLKNIKSNEKREISSLSSFSEIIVKEAENTLEFQLKSPEDINGVSYILTAFSEDTYIEWTVEVVNENDEWSVMSVSYPSPEMTADYFDYFMPLTSGIVIKDAGNKSYESDSDQEYLVRMHHFAVYGKKDGIYVGIEDPDSYVKRYRTLVKDGKAELRVDFIGINGNLSGNSFKVNGTSKWQYFEGDWYDATLIYADFVYKKAKWLPDINENGRPDTPQKFKEIPFWVFDYIPNTERQRDNYPRSFIGVNLMSDRWYKDVIKLKRELGVPLAYHVYNWHHIPFNVEYPHFMPAKDEFKKGCKELKKENVYIFPYINSVSWEADDHEMNHEMTFKNTGKYGCTVKEDGSNLYFPYPQTTISGKTVDLAPMCPSYEKWHDINYDTIRKMERELDIDGIYLDQVSCFIKSCYNPEHGHTLGGGNYWVEGYNKMMEKIKAGRQRDSFYYSECNTEGYMKAFDGFLTWMWVANGDVPAYPLVYSGYIQLLGRITDGKKKEDVEFYKYETAKSLLYGQQIGWTNADILHDKERLDFLKKIVSARYKYKDLFINPKMLRPPYVKTELEPITTTPALKFEEDVVMERVLAGAWQYKDKSKTVIFIVNVDNREADFEVSFDIKEYGLNSLFLPENSKIEDGKCIIEGKLSPTELRIIEIQN